MKLIHKIIRPSVLWLINLIGIVLAVCLIDNKELFITNKFSTIIFVVGICYWLFFFISAFKIHREWPKNAISISKIITKGSYNRVRHPMYSGDIICAWAFFIQFPSYRILVGVLWMTIVLWAWMILEEKMLVKKFGEKYKEYQRNVPMFIPRISQKKLLI